MTDQNISETEALIPSFDVDTETLVTATGPSGFEEEHQQAWQEQVQVDDVDVRVEQDTHGNVVAVAGDTERDDAIAFAAHGDQIGLMIRSIDEEGLVRPGAIGVIDPSVLPGRRVQIHVGDDEPVTGVVGQPAIHIREDDTRVPSDVEQQRIDIGATDETVARDELGVSVGDPITFDIEVTRIGNGRLVGHGLDNRAGTVTVAEVFNRLAMADLDRPVVAISTVQEEIGQTGAKFAGRSLADELGIPSLWDLVSYLYVVDVTFATDHPRTPAMFTSEVELGGGPVVTRGGINGQEAVEAAKEAGEETLGGKDEFQIEAITGQPGTDTEAFLEHSRGVRTCYIGIPNRYMHTPAEMVDVGDLERTADLLEQLPAVIET